MKAVRIAHLKSHLSQHLRDVRSGQAITVLDRNTPVARLVPFDSNEDIIITKPSKNHPSIGRIRLPAMRKIDVDVVDLLLADRRRR